MGAAREAIGAMAARAAPKRVSFIMERINE
jgi:hypothetical protein